MFEIHGWIHLSDDCYENSLTPESGLLAQLRQQVDALRQDHFTVHFDMSINDHYTILFTALLNHRRRTIFDLLDWVAVNLPGSYGLVYWADDEASHEGDFNFNVLRVARGEIAEFEDPFLSPRIPAIEDPYDPERG